MTQLSVIIITKNEENNIRRALESVKWADEIVVVDSHSTDNTVNICREYTDKVFSCDWPGFGKQKQRALDKASHEWVFSLDADEVVSEALKDSILKTIAQPTQAAYSLQRALYFYNKRIKYAVGSDQPVRLFNAKDCHFTPNLVHEKVIYPGETGMLEGSLAHYSFADLETLVSRMNQYTSISAEQKYKKGKRPSLLHPIIAGLWTFLNLYIFKGGFRDGAEGLALAVSFAEGAYYRHMKCFFLIRGEKMNESE